MTEIVLERDVLEANDRIAAELKKTLAEKRIFAVNLLSSPGSGKTSILEKTLDRLKGKIRCAVIEGDVQTGLDRDRLAAKGFPVVLINTGLSGGGCHLDADQVEKAVSELLADPFDLLFIENVGNLVCPAEFDLGEDCKVTVLSIPEGEDKPAKYPVAFHSSELVLINKMDLLPHLDFDVNILKVHLEKICPKSGVLYLSTKTGEGLDQWVSWLMNKVREKKEE